MAITSATSPINIAPSIFAATVVVTVATTGDHCGRPSG
jgi:hypothetical protein